MAKQDLALDTLAWPVPRLGELIENLARRGKLISRPAKISQPSDKLAQSDDETIGRWIDVAAGHLGMEAEPVDLLYGEVERFLQAVAPAILRLPGPFSDGSPRLIALVRGGSSRATVLSPELRIKKIPIENLRKALCSPYETGLTPGINQLLADAGVPENRLHHARRAILSEQLSPLRIQGGWLLHLLPGASLSSLFRHSRVYFPIALQLTTYLMLQLLGIATWFVIGRGIFQGHFDLGWLLAWVILLFSTIPVQMMVGDSQGELSISTGSVFKQRLLYGTLRLDPEEIRHQGRGQFLNRVMDSEAVEMLALNGGYMAILAIIELVLAGIILAKGAGGPLNALLLGIWTVISLIILWRYFQVSREWSSTYREMTNDLVERMVGHQTRLAQEDHRHWHDDEDQALERYLKLSEHVDQVGIQVNAIISRGWMLVGLLGIAVPFISGSASPQAMAISLGGIILASRALARMAGGAQSLSGVLIAWQQVGPIFNAAARPRELQSLDFVSFQPTGSESDDQHDQALPSVGSDQPLLQVRDVSFRYRPQGRPVVQDCSLQIHPGSHILLEGPSGGGKSTLASILTGLRVPEHGSMLLWGFDRQILGTEEWRRRVVMAPQFQENYVFSDTLGFNLLMGRRWPPLPEDLQEADELLRELGLGEVFDRMPSGFQQMLGESGWQLSHGERSRLFIARTLLQKADMIILDESFGALDPENLSRALQCVLNRASTLMVIAHP